MTRLTNSSSPNRSMPPSLAMWLLARALRDEGERDMVLGDLHEEFSQNTRAWYWRQALSIAVHALMRRTRAPHPPRASGDPLMYSTLKDVQYAWRALLKR